jgi:hypothetical protein
MPQPFPQFWVLLGIRRAQDRKDLIGWSESQLFSAFPALESCHADVVAELDIWINIGAETTTSKQYGNVVFSCCEKWKIILAKTSIKWVGYLGVQVELTKLFNYLKFFFGWRRYCLPQSAKAKMQNDMSVF